MMNVSLKTKDQVNFKVIKTKDGRELGLVQAPGLDIFFPEELALPRGVGPGQSVVYAGLSVVGDLGRGRLDVSIYKFGPEVKAAKMELIEL